MLAALGLTRTTSVSRACSSATTAVISFVMLATARGLPGSPRASTEPSSPTRYHEAAAICGSALWASALTAETGTARARRTTTVSRTARITGGES